VLKKEYKEKCDIWTLGVINYELLYSILPGVGNEDLERINNIKKHGINFPYKIRISEDSRKFLKGCLKVDEKDIWSWQ